MKERGEVTKTDGQTVTIRFLRSGRCDRCQLCKVAKDCKYVELKAKNTVGATVGDAVEVQTVRPLITLLIGLIYAVPLVLLAVAVGVGAGLNWRYTMLVAVAAFVAGFVIAVPVERYTLRKLKGYYPTVLRICTEKGAATHEDTGHDLYSDSEQKFETDAEQKFDSAAKPSENMTDAAVEDVDGKSNDVSNDKVNIVEAADEGLDDTVRRGEVGVKAEQYKTE